MLSGGSEFLLLRDIRCDFGYKSLSFFKSPPLLSFLLDQDRGSEDVCDINYVIIIIFIVSLSKNLPWTLCLCSPVALNAPIRSYQKKYPEMISVLLDNNHTDQVGGWGGVVVVPLLAVKQRCASS